MKRNKSLMLSGVIAIAMTAGLSQVAGAADLVSVYRDAIQYDAQFAGARASLEAGRENVADRGFSGAFWRQRSAGAG